MIEVTYSIRQSKARHCRNLLHETAHQPKDFWKNSKKFFPTKQSSKDLPPMMNIDENRTFDKTIIANSFCKFFSTIGTNLQNQVIWLNNRIWKTYTNKRIGIFTNLTNSFRFKPTTPSSVEKQLKTLKTSKASGPDNIPGTMLKDACKELATPLCHLINLSTGIFPTNEKLAKVTPIYKSGERSLFENYRPISVTQHIVQSFRKSCRSAINRFS